MCVKRDLKLKAMTVFSFNSIEIQNECFGNKNSEKCRLSPKKKTKKPIMNNK